MFRFNSSDTSLSRHAPKKAPRKPAAAIPAGENAASGRETPGPFPGAWGAALPLRPILAMVFAAGVALMVLSTIMVIIRSYTAMPIMDHWAEVLWLRDFYAGHWHLSDLWRQHNEHRILFPRFFFLTDSFLFRGTSVFLLVSILLVQAAHAGIFIREAGKTVSREVRLTVAAIIVALFFSGMNLENFARPFQISFVLVFCAGTLSIRALIQYSESTAPGYLGACLAWATVATWSLASGILIWPALLLTAAALKLRARVWLPLCAVGGLSCFLYFFHYHSVGGHTDTLLSLTHPLLVLAYVCAYLAIPFSRINHFMGVGIGLIALIGLAGAVVQSFRRQDLPRVVRLSVGVMVFITGGAFLTALGRMSLQPPETALRYATPACIFWVCALLVLLAWPRAPQPGIETATYPILPIALTALILTVVPAHLEESARFIQIGTSVQEAALAMTAGVPSRDEAKILFPDPGFLFPLVEFLRAHRLSVFAGAGITMGEPIQSHYRLVGGDRCQGFWDVATVVDSPNDAAESDTGWAWDNAANQPPKLVIIADRSTAIRGIGRLTREREDVAQAAHNPRMASSGWFGFDRRVPGAQPYRAYALLSDGVSLCALHNSFEVPKTVYAVFRRGQWVIDSNKSGAWEPTDRTLNFGLAGDYPVAGDWDGSGVTRAGVFRNGVWYLDMNDNGRWDEGDKQISFGMPGDLPIVGDWNQTGVTKLGIFRRGAWILDWNGNQRIDPADRQFSFGLPGDIPVAGDWDNSGKLRIGVFRRGAWYLDMDGDFQFDDRDKTFTYGVATDQPVVGDWSGLGTVRIGVFRGGQWILDSSGNLQMDGTVKTGAFGLPGDVAVPWKLR